MFMPRSRKFRRLFLVLFVLIAVFQLTGVEEAFCDDSFEEAACSDCLTCPGHYFTAAGTVPTQPQLRSASFSAGFRVLLPEELHSAFLRPPIALR